MFAGVALFFGGRELMYSMFAKFTDAKVVGQSQEARSAGRNGGVRQVVVVNYEFTQTNRRIRRESDEVPFDASRPVGPTVSVEYVAGLAGASRIRDGRHGILALVVCGLMGVMALAMFGAWWYAKYKAQTQPRIAVQKALPPKENFESITMSNAELAGWWIAGIIGAVLIATSLTGKFDIYGYFVVPSVVLVYVSLFVINMQHRAERRRTHALRRVAKQLKLVFPPPGLDRFLQSLERFHLFSIGQNPIVSNVMAGQIDGTDVAVFDFTHIIGSGKSARTVCQTVIWLQRRGTKRTEFALRPESYWNTLGSWLGHGDINFESHPAFSGKYLLRGDDEPAIRELFSDEVLTFFEQQDSGVSLEGSGNKLLYYRAGVRIEPNDLRSLLKETLRLNSMLS